MMRAPSINLARRPFRNNTVYYSVFATCLILLLSASIYNVYDFFGRSDELESLESDLASRTVAYRSLYDEVEAMKREIKKLNLKAINTRSSFANQLILSRLFSWSLLFDRLEEIIPPEVKIRSIRPSISPKGIEIQLDGLSRTAELLYEFEENLDRSEFFANVYPESENSRETRNEINFDLSMKYIPAGLSRPAEEVATAESEAPAEEGDGDAGKVEQASEGGPSEPGAGEATDPADGEDDAENAGQDVPPDVQAGDQAGAGSEGEATADAAGKPAAKAGPVETVSEIPEVTSPEDVLKNLGIRTWTKSKGKGKGKAKAKAEPSGQEGDKP